MKPKSQSPTFTYCSDVENSNLSQIRRSQRLQEKCIQNQAAKPAIEMLPKRSSQVKKSNRNSRSISGSPQLFVETDEECSQLRQQQSGSQHKASTLHKFTGRSMSQSPTNVEKQNGSVKRAASQVATPDAPAAKRKRPRSTVSVKKRNCVTLEKSQATTTARRGRKPKKSATDEVESTFYSRNTAVLGEQSAKRVDQEAYKAASSLAIAPKISMQSVLPAEYPAHFVHQLPPLNAQPSLLSGFQAELRRVAQQRAQTGAGPTIEALIAEMEQTSNTVATAAIDTRQLCPTPDATPITASYSATYGASPNTQSASSTSPSMSESLGELFGTKNIRNVLNIAQAHRYKLRDSHLPAIALMLNVELGRLRAVLRLTQRLTDAQLLQMTQELEISKQEPPVLLYNSLSYGGDHESDDAD